MIAKDTYKYIALSGLACIYLLLNFIIFAIMFGMQWGVWLAFGSLLASVPWWKIKQNGIDEYIRWGEDRCFVAVFAFAIFVCIDHTAARLL